MVSGISADAEADRAVRLATSEAGANSLTIVRAGLALARPEIVKAGGRTLSMLRLTITDAGRRALVGA
jgi:hypothetical protein